MKYALVVECHDGRIYIEHSPAIEYDREKVAARGLAIVNSPWVKGVKYAEVYEQ